MIFFLNTYLLQVKFAVLANRVHIIFDATFQPMQLDLICAGWGKDTWRKAWTACRWRVAAAGSSRAAANSEQSAAQAH